jgi:hypothetical protein
VGGKRWIAAALAALVVCAVVPAAAGAHRSTGRAAAAATVSGTFKGCLSRRPYSDEDNEVYYTKGCTGHDEPELDPLSSMNGSAENLTWNVTLPKDGKGPVSAVGPTFWFGGPVTDPQSLFGEAFLELQFYPDAMVSKCTSGGGFVLSPSKNTYTACSPVWSVVGNTEPAAFNSMLTDTVHGGPLVMKAGDLIHVHFYVTPQRDGWHVTVSDQTRHTAGTIVLYSPSAGPMMPVFNKQVLGNSLAWGLVYDAPASFVWEIGHTSNFASPPGQYCVPGQTDCQSYNAASWAKFSPLKIRSVTFNNGTKASQWAVVNDLGGSAEVTQRCKIYGAPYCIYPWYTKGTDHTFRYGINYPDTAKNYGEAEQFATSPECAGPFGAQSTFCPTVIK